MTQYLNYNNTIILKRNATILQCHHKIREKSAVRDKRECMQYWGGLQDMADKIHDSL